MTRFLQRVATMAFIAVVGITVAAQKPDRSTPPKPVAPRALKLAPVHKSVLPNGLAVWIVEQHEVPLVQVNVIVRAGGAADPAGKYGVASMTANMLDEGAGGKSALELADAVEFLGAELTTFSTFDYSAVRLSTPVAGLADALPLLRDVVATPAFPAEELERLRKERLTELLQARDDPAAILDIAFPRFVFGDKHRYGTTPGGRIAEVKTMTLDDLRAFHRGFYRPEHSVLVAGRRRDAQRGVAAAGADARAMEARGYRCESDPTALRDPTDEASDLPGRQTRRCAIADPYRLGRFPRSTPDYPAVQVLNTILGGAFTSRLNTNLRETHGYSYGAFSSFTERISPGPFSAYAGVQTDKTAEALKEFFNEFASILRPIPAEELLKARNYLALGFPAQFETNGDLAQKLEEQVVHSLPDGYFPAYIRAVVQVSSDAVEKAAQRYIQSDKFAVVVVGDRKAIEPGIRALNLGPINVVTIDQLLGPM